MVKQRDPVLLDLNAAGVFDGRATPAENGWRTGLLAEVPLGRWKPGAEFYLVTTKIPLR